MHPTTPRPTSADPDVFVLRWPSEDALRRQLTSFRLPRVLVVDPGVRPPEPADELEDWLRSPVDPIDLEARTRNLRHRAPDPTHPSPRVDDDDLLWVGRSWLSLTPTQAPVVRVLIEHLDRVVHFDTVVDIYVAAGGSGHTASIRTMLVRLKARLRSVGLELLTVRRRGVVLSWTNSTASVRPEPRSVSPDDV
jgi:hypothetical protein